MTDDDGKTKAQLLDEIRILRERVEVLENANGIPAAASSVQDEDAKGGHATLEFRDSAHFCHEAFDAIEDGITILDRDFNILRVNGCVQRVYAREAPLEGRKCHEAFHQRQTPCPWCPSVKALETGQTQRVEVPCPDAENPADWLSLSAFPMRTETGEIIGTIECVRDITEHKRTLEALRRSEESLRAVIDGVQAAIVVHDGDGKIILANQMARELLDPFTTDTDGKRASELDWCMFREDGSQVTPEEYPVTRVLRTGEAVTGFLAGAHRPGESEMHWAIVNAVPIFDKDGSLGRVIVSFVDITERKQMEEELRRYEHMVSGASDKIALLDRDLRYLAVNEAYARDLGATRDELIGRTPADAFGEEIFHSVIEPTATRCLTGEEVHFQEWMDISPIGLRHIDAVYSPHLGEHGEVLGYAVFARDDTERAQMEEELRRYESMVSGATDLISLIDTDFRFLAANEACLRAFSRTRDELVGHAASEIFGEEFFRTVIEPNAKRCLLGEEVHDQRWVDLPGPGRRHMDVAYSLYLGTRDETLGFAIFGRDDTEREEAQRALEERARELAEMHGRLEVRNAELQKALDEIATLRGILPICSFCKKVRDDAGYWQRVDTYISHHTGALVSHGICPECLEKHYSELIKSSEDSSSSGGSPQFLNPGAPSPG